MDVSKNFLQQLAARSNDLTFVYDYHSNAFIYLSDSAKAFFDIAVEEILRNPAVLAGLLQIEDRPYVMDKIEKLSNGMPYVDAEFRLFMPDQSLKWVRAKVYTLFNAGSKGTHLAGIVEDITKRKEHEISLYTIKEQKDTVLQILGHDLRGPLNTISLAIELINQKISEDSRLQARKLLDIISSTCKHSLNLISEMLSLEYLETQKVHFKKVRFDIVDRICNQIEIYQLMGNNDKQFILTTSEQKVYATLDLTRFMLITENLLSNAYKFTKADGRIEVTIREEEKTILISVADNGMGIPEKLKPYIFDKFTKARRRGHQGEKPVGLGMHIVRMMVEQLEGKIWFESREGTGTTFFVELPKE